MMTRIKRYGMYLASLTVFRDILLVDTNGLPTGMTQREYDSQCKQISELAAFQNETKKIEASAKKAIYRTTSNLEAIAYHRGIIHAIESLKQRMNKPKAFEKR